MLKEQKHRISTLDTKIEHQVNSSMHTTLSFRNLSKSDTQRWEDRKSL